MVDGKELDPSDIPLLPSKDFIKNYLEEMISEGYDPMEVVKSILKNEIQIALEELKNNNTDCKNESITSIITLNAIDKANDVYSHLKEYEKSGEEEELKKASTSLEVLLGLIRASSRAVPVRLSEILEECCPKKGERGRTPASSFLSRDGEVGLR